MESTRHNRWPSPGMSGRLALLGMILCHDQEEREEEEAIYHHWALALAGKGRAVAELLV